MSSTGRGSERSPYDWYPTPKWCIRRILDVLTLPGGHWLEPCAGTGNIIDVVQTYRQDVWWSAIEIRSDPLERLESSLKPSKDEHDFGYVYHRDFLSVASIGPLPLISITNPPFSLAQEFILHSMKLVTHYVVMLLRLNFLGTDERLDFLLQHPPDVYVLPNRPQFDIRKDGTDSTEYAWFVWCVKSPRNSGRLYFLDRTPLSERQQDRYEEMCTVSGLAVEEPIFSDWLFTP